MKAYLVCESCGGYGEQIPSTREEEAKLTRVLSGVTYISPAQMRCPGCGGRLELLTPEEFSRRQMGLDD
jgi:uncharacterized protein with PIN domain